jgi:hypothetical protein
MSKGNRNTRYRAGADFEREVLLLMKTWLHKKYKVLIEGIRSAGSKGIRDLVLIHRNKAVPVVWYISCKRSGEIAPQERLILLQTCKAIGAKPALAYRLEVGPFKWQTRLRLWDYEGQVKMDIDLKSELGMVRKLPERKPPPKGKPRRRNRATTARYQLSKSDWRMFKRMRDLIAGPTGDLVGPSPIAARRPEEVE